GERVRELLLHSGDETPISSRAEMLLYMAARAQLVEEVIRPALGRGETVVSDRFLTANIVYQAHAGGLSIDHVRSVGDVTVDGIQPDGVVVLDMRPEEADDRLQRPLDRMEDRGQQYRQKLREGFLAEAARVPERIVVVDAAGSIDEVHRRVVAALTPMLNR
ncbi:MAG: dTMP kinase, partial [Planctomycetota bacterium]